MASPGRRRLLEDTFQAVAAAASGALMLWAGNLLRADPAAGFVPDAFRSLTDLQSAAGLAAGGAGLLLLAWWSAGLAAAFLWAVLLRCGKQRAAGAVGVLSPAFLKRLAAAVLGLQLATAPLTAFAAPAAAAVVSTGAETRMPEQGGAYALASPAADPSWRTEGQPVPGSSGARAAAASGTGPAADPSWKPSPAPVDGSLLIPGAPTAANAASPAATVTVTAGDTLWDLAAAQLGYLATDHEIARYWPAWHELNRGVIGPDPNLLLPGQVLAVPPPPAE